MDVNFKMRRGNGQIVTMQEVVQLIADYILDDPKAKYEMAIGTDSQTHNYTKMVRSIYIHRVGKGAIFFSETEFLDRITNLRYKIVTETQKSLEIANGLLEQLELTLMNQDVCLDDIDLNFQIHCDIGQEGKTSDLIAEITMWVTSQGYDCKIKPDSIAASSIADKISK